MRLLKRLLPGLPALMLIALLGLYVAKPTLTTRLVGLMFGMQGPQQSIAGGVVPALVVAADSERTIPADALARIVGIAIDQGLIGSVDDTVATYVREWAVDERRRITIREMLQQASGIDFPGFTGLLEMTLGDDVEPYTLNRGVAEPAGEHFEYNNINPEVLGILLQRISGKHYSQYLERHIWQYVSKDNGKIRIDSAQHGIPIPFCCLDAPARSWLRFGLLHLDGGRVGERRVVPAQWMRDIVTPSPASACTSCHPGTS
jgi:CubicO group peptidase (beta-lactamase class C family)